ncbi:3-oxoadipyl-CoA thiolase [Aphelenchoides fujianensis]|nr:3-oxoadipyl-CoA thiolase [Aphelenchoides fujianensis]
MTTAYLCDGIRTPIGRYGGALSKVRADDLAAIPLKALAARNPNLDLSALDEVVLGCANQAGEDNRNVARMALLLAGYPLETPGVTVNRLCASGLEAVGYAARAILSGQNDLVIAGGVESMSRAPFAYGVDSMPETAENVAADYGVSREDQDAFALRSQQRAAAAQANGFLAGEITPVEIPGKAGPTIVERDEHPRETTLEALAKLKPVVREGGTVTAGNASGVNDGAVALIVASEDAVKRHGLTPRARITGYATAGVAPRVMGIGPVPAVRKLLAKTGLSIGDFDAVELNEAFAAQGLAVLRQLSLPDDGAHVNANGGAIALGHPLGASGARLVLTALRQLEATGGKRGLATLCIGVGQGAALAFERL